MSDVEFEAVDNNSGDASMRDKSEQAAKIRKARKIADAKDVGKRIRRAREDAELTVGELAESAQVNKSSLYRYEKGETFIDALDLQNICNALHVSPVYFLYEADDFGKTFNPQSASFDINDSGQRVATISVLLSILNSDDQKAVHRIVQSLVELKMGKKEFEKFFLMVTSMIPVIGEVAEDLESSDDFDGLAERVGKSLNLKFSEKLEDDSPTDTGNE